VELIRPNAYLFQTSAKTKNSERVYSVAGTFNLYLVDTEHVITNTLFDQLPEKDLFFAKGSAKNYFINVTEMELAQDHNKVRLVF
jgi:hypothetical protein